MVACQEEECNYVSFWTTATLISMILRRLMGDGRETVGVFKSGAIACRISCFGKRQRAVRDSIMDYNFPFNSNNTLVLQFRKKK